ncbi:MAG: glycosyltransferase, partial [Candidatus Cloacimonadaceae bacterium]|nr:glycosyltransferase [Candidatus Cloacimonadaceae bacterium]
MRLIFVCTTIDRGGAEILLLNIARQLVKEHAVTVIYLKGKASLGADFAALGIRPIRFSLQNLIPIFRALWQGPKSILQGWMYHGNILATMLYLLSGGRNTLYWSIHHSALAYASDAPSNALKLRLTALLSRLPDNIIYVSAPTRDEHIQFGYDNTNPVVIHNGIDLECFKYGETAGREIREKLGIEDDDIVLGAVGRNHPVKDYATFFKAAAILLPKYPGLHVVVAGRDLAAENITGLLNDISASDLERIHFLGERSDIPAVLSAIDIYALSSLSESFSLALIEAL